MWKIWTEIIRLSLFVELFAWLGKRHLSLILPTTRLFLVSSSDWQKGNYLNIWSPHPPTQTSNAERVVMQWRHDVTLLWCHLWHQQLWNTTSACRYLWNIFPFSFMADILCWATWNAISSMKITNFVTNVLMFIPTGLIYNKLSLHLVMIWWPTGFMPLPEPMLTKIHDNIWHH